MLVVMLVGTLVLGPVLAGACVVAEQVTLEEVVGLGAVEGLERSYVGLVEREVIQVWPQTSERTAGSLSVVARIWGKGSTEQELRYLGGAYRGGPSTTNTCGSGLPTGAPMGQRTYRAVVETSSGALGTIGVENEALTSEHEALLQALLGTPMVLDRPPIPEQFPYAPPRPVAAASGRPSPWLLIGLTTGAASVLLLLVAIFHQRRPQEPDAP